MIAMARIHLLVTLSRNAFSSFGYADTLSIGKSPNISEAKIHLRKNMMVASSVSMMVASSVNMTV